MAISSSVAVGARHVDDDARGLGLGVLLGVGLLVDGAVGVEKLVGDEGEDGCATGRDAPLGDLRQEAREELADVAGGREFGKAAGKKIGGEVGRVIGSLWHKGAQMEMSKTESRMSGGMGKTAAAAIGKPVGAAGVFGGREGWSCRGGASSCGGVHEFFLVARGYPPGSDV
jgi:hypothetical protein